MSPPLRAWFTAAPAAHSMDTVCVWPLSLATSRGVVPSAFVWLMALCPASSSELTSLVRPWHPPPLMQGHPVELISPLGSDVDPVGILDVMQGCADVRA